MKKHYLFFLVFPFLTISLAAQQTVEEIVARVNDDIITRSDFDRSAKQLRQELGQDFSGADLERQYALKEKNVLRDLIDQLLLIQRAKDAGISVENDLIKQLDDIRQKNNLKTLDDLEQMAAQQGVNFEDFKNNLRNQLFTQAVIRQEVGRNVQVTQDEINKYYQTHKNEFERPEEVRFREILISTEGKSDTEKQEAAKKAADVAARARKGENFSDLAKKYSDGPTAKDGGEQDYIQRHLLLKEIADVAFSLKRNEVSEPISTKFGYKIIKLEDRHESGLQPVERVTDQISNILYMQAMGPALRDFLTRAREDAFVEIKPGYQDSGAPALASK
ncbi:MAG: peptidylprolyl isomerase [Acidobacteriia bacterium]|nr:peptidylprolyl isomerase [Terriglobia bacterium]